MARKSKEQILREEEDKLEAINFAAEERVKALLPGLIAEAVKGLATTITGDRQEAAAATEITSKDRSLLSGLATAFVAAADPKNKNRTVDPAITAARREAHKRMVDLLTAANARGDVPIYGVKVKMFLDNTKIDPEWRHEGTKKFHMTRIKWAKPPNQGMVPMNDVAKAIFAEYERSIGSVSAEGLPDAPWLDPSARAWVHSKDGIVLAPPIDEVPEMAEVTRAASPFADPRLDSSVGAPRKEIHVFGTLAPTVVETNGLG